MPTDAKLDRGFDEHADRQRSHAILIAVGAAALLAWALSSREETNIFSVGLIGALLLFSVCLLKIFKARESRSKCEEYRVCRTQLKNLFEEDNPTAIERGIRELREAKLDPDLRQLVAAWMPTIEKRLEDARQFREFELTRQETNRRRETVSKATARMRELEHVCVRLNRYEGFP